jgi:hypothetical protein
MDLYRVIPFKRLQQIADQAALAFVSYRSFEDDPHEASLIQALNTQDGLKEVTEVLKEHGEHPASALPLIMAARSADASAFMQCWTKTEEHNLMWERYGDGGNAVRLKMDDAGQSNLPPWISFNDARYEDSFDLWKEIQLVTAAQRSVSISTPLTWQSGEGGLFKSGIIDFRKSLTFKLKAYHHENEVRLMTPIANDMVSPGQSRPSAPWVNHPGGNTNVTLVPIGSVKNVVTSVMAGPRATDEFQRDVDAFCKTHGLVYEGKSLLMTPRFTGSKKIFTNDPDDKA